MIPPRGSHTTLSTACSPPRIVGAPIANAEIIVCDSSGPCTFVASEAMISASPFATSVAAVPSATPSTYALARRGADGTYRVTFTTTTLDSQRGLDLVVTAPGRELIKRWGLDSNAENPLSGPIMLRPASPIDLAPTCARQPCVGPVTSATTEHTPYPGLHLERVPPGTYTLRVRRNATKPDEEYGTAVVEVGFTVKPQRVKVPMRRLGTGESIRGTAKLMMNGNAVSPVTVNVRCSGEPAVYRTAQTDAAGNFELRDVGRPPCNVDLGPLPSYPSGTYSVTVDSLPATGVKLDATVSESRYPDP